MADLTILEEVEAARVKFAERMDIHHDALAHASYKNVLLRHADFLIAEARAAERMREGIRDAVLRITPDADGMVLEADVHAADAMLRALDRKSVV